MIRVVCPKFGYPVHILDINLLLIEILILHGKDNFTKIMKGLLLVLKLFQLSIFFLFVECLQQLQNPC